MNESVFPNARLRELLEAATVAVRDGERYGTGFFISESLILTCAHVAQSATVKIIDSTGTEQSAVVIDRRPETAGGASWRLPDLALLRAEVPSQSYLTIDSPDVRVEGAALLTCGFAIAGEDEPSLTYERPRFLSMDPVHGGRLAKLTDCTLARGMSGSPIVDESTGRVVGVVKRTRSSAVAAGGWAIPIGMLDTHFTEHVRSVRRSIEDRGMRSYLRAVIMSNCTVEPRGMRRTTETRDVVFPLDDIFVSLETRNYSPLDLQVSELAAVSPERIAQDLANRPYLAFDVLQGGAHPDDAATGRGAVGAGAETSVTLQALLTCGKPVVLLGDPGSGKSTLLQWLALSFARAALRGDAEVVVAQRHIEPASDSDDLSSLGTTRVPILVRAATYIEARERATATSSPIPSLLEFALTSAESQAEGEPGYISRMLAGAFRQGRVLFLLDGLDEVSSIEGRRVVRAEIAHLAQLSELDDDGEGNAIIVTSRHAGYRQAPMTIDVVHAVLHPLSDAAVLRFLYTWSYAVRRWVSQVSESPAERLAAEARTRARQIYDSLQAAPSLAVLARTPLMLTVVSLVYEESGRLPRMRVDLLQTMGRLLVERRPTHHTYLDAQDLLGPFALWLQENRPSGLATKDEFRDQVARWTHRIGMSEQAGRRGIAEEFCATAQEQFGLIVERGHGLVGFQHRLFQEFFAAIEILNTGRDALSVLRQHALDPVWREIVLLTAGLLAATSRSAVSEFLKELMGAPDVKIPGGEFSYRPTLLVADCLLEVERSLPAVAHKVAVPLIGAILDRRTGQSSFGSVARERIGGLVLRYPDVIDGLLTSAYQRADQVGRSLISEFVMSLQCDLPTLRSKLYLADLAGETTMAERRTLVSFDRLSSSTSAVPSISPEPEDERFDRSFAPLVKLLESYGESMARELVLGFITAVPSPPYSSDSRRQLAVTLLRAISGQKGVQATLLGVAASWLDGGIVMEAYRAIASRSTHGPAADFLLWCIASGTGREQVLSAWSEIGPEQSHLVLLRSFQMGLKSAVLMDIAWVDLDIRVKETRAELGAAADASRIHLSLVILNGFKGLVLDSARLDNLLRVVQLDVDCEILVERILAKSVASADLDWHQSGIDDTGPGVFKLWKTVCQAESDMWSSGALDRLLGGAARPNGLWQKRVERLLFKPRSIESIPGEMLDEAGALQRYVFMDGGNYLGLDSMLVGFLRSIRVESEEVGESLLRSYGAEFVASILLNSPRPMFRQFWDMASSGEGSLRDGAIGVLYECCLQMGPAVVVSTEADPVTMAGLLVGLGEMAERLAGFTLATAALTGADPDAIAEQLLVPVGDVGLRTREFALDVIAHAKSPARAAPFRERIGAWGRSQRGSRSLGGDNLAAIVIALEAGSSSPVDLDALCADWQLTIDDVTKGLLLLGAHPTPWFGGGSSSAAAAGLDRLITVIDSWGSHTEFAYSLLANVMSTLQREAELRSSASARYGNDWPTLRFGLVALLSVAHRAPDAFVAASSGYNVPDLLEGFLSYGWSFGVRCRSFQLLCFYGMLTTPMIHALRHFVFSAQLVTQQVFTELRLIRAVEPRALISLGELLADGGRPAVAGLDLVRHLSRCAVFLGDEQFRVGMWQLLGQVGASVSPYAECHLPSGVAINEQRLFGDVQYEIGTLRQWWSSDSRWLTLTESAVPPSWPPVRSGNLRAEDTFASVFLQRARNLLMKGGHISDQA